GAVRQHVVHAKIFQQLTDNAALDNLLIVAWTYRLEDGAVQQGLAGRRVGIKAGDDGRQLQVIPGQHEAAVVAGQVPGDGRLRHAHLRRLVDHHEVERRQLAALLEARIDRRAEDDLLAVAQPAVQVSFRHDFDAGVDTLPGFRLAEQQREWFV